MTRIGVIASAGGSVFREVVAATANHDFEFLVLTDRECGVEPFCAASGLPSMRIVEADRTRLSQKMADALGAWNADMALLYFGRLVGPELFKALPCVNVHPSLLPAFSGIGAATKALRAGVKFIGCTAHFVDASLDGGPIIAQTVAPIPVGADLALVECISFIQKTIVSLSAIDALHRNGRFDQVSRRATGRTSPPVETPDFIVHLNGLQARFGLALFP